MKSVCAKHKTELEWEPISTGGCHLGCVIIPAHWRCKDCDKEKREERKKRKWWKFYWT